LVIHKIDIEAKTIQVTFFIRKFPRQIKASLISVNPVKFTFPVGKGICFFEFRENYLVGTYNGTYGTYSLIFKKVMR
jgi:hypothetical protein